MNLLKKLADAWRNEAKGPTMATSKIGREILYRCAYELDSLVKGTEALGHFREGNGVGLPFATVAWVVVDGNRFIREWHPMQPDADGAPKGNWWPLEEGGERFSEHEVTHYSVIEVPTAPDGNAPPPVLRKRRRSGEFTAVLGRNVANTCFIGYALVPIPHPEASGAPVVVQAQGLDVLAVEKELADRCDMVLRTYFSSYSVVRL